MGLALDLEGEKKVVILCLCENEINKCPGHSGVRFAERTSAHRWYLSAVRRVKSVVHSVCNLWSQGSRFLYGLQMIPSACMGIRQPPLESTTV